MCDIKDARRNVELAKLQEQEHKPLQARESFLEAASIYVLQTEVQRSNKWMSAANWCYKKSREVIGERWEEELTKQELAKRTLEELSKKPKDILSMIEMEIS